MQVKREMQAEAKETEKAHALAATYGPPVEVEHEAAPILAASGILYKCPMIGPHVLPRNEMEKCIEEFLLSQLPDEPEMTSALMIQTLNKDKDKVKVCIDTICKYLDNLIANSAEEKFRKIRMNNKAFQDRVAQLQGANEFLQAVGFEHKLIPGPNEVEETFYVISEDKCCDTEKLRSLKEILIASEPIRPELDHARRVFHPSGKATQFEVPPDFYNIKPEELKKEQQLKQEAVERFGMLRTKEMREREQQRELRKYRFTLIRIRFPDGIILQGTFRALDKLSVVLDFVKDNLETDWLPFTLNSATGQKLTNVDQSLAEIGLAPAAIVNFAWDEDIMKDIAASQSSSSLKCLSQDALACIEYL